MSRASDLTSDHLLSAGAKAGLILHARYAGNLAGSMPHLENRLRVQPGAVTGMFTSDRMHLHIISRNGCAFWQTAMA
ncbi:hypothetical protein BN2475_1090001 [Paraburkholderia ribeironis]|uniref:Uncharacterized protein n=1 Tax=Paraburkholderia ribeironis TaxID=1247936 RepID=A0A1N7SMS5_9BURK|nr:hypothetical protein BN2475_1090001 [Paraburkholderia ribeironis]